MPFKKMDSTWSYNKIGRNEPCPCGSGKKFKKCCMGKVNTSSDKTGTTSNTQVRLMSEQLNDKVDDIIDDLNNNHYEIWNQMSEDDYFDIIDSIYSDKRYDKYSFTLTEMKGIDKKYGPLPHDQDKDSVNKMKTFCVKAVKEKYAEKDICQAIIDHFMHLIDCYDKEQYKESWVIANCAEGLIEYLEAQDKVPLFFFEKVIKGIAMHEEARFKKEEQVIESMGFDLAALREGEGSIIDKIKNLALTKEQEEKAAEIFNQNPTFKKEQEEIIFNRIKKMAEMITEGELNELLLGPEEIRLVGSELLELFSEKLPEKEIKAMPEDQISETVGELMINVVNKWEPELFDNSRWAHIVEVIKSEIETMEGREQTDKYQILLTTLLFLDNNDENWVKEYIGKAIIASSIKHTSREF